MKQEELNKILELHRKWLSSEDSTARADLRNADLRNAYLHGATLECAILNDANLRNANLSGANLFGATLRGADLEGTILTYAKNIYTFNAYDTSRRMVYCVKHKDTFMCQAGCFWGTLDELETKVKEDHNSKVYLGNIAIMREILKDYE